jgi:cytochrome P450
VPSASNKPRQDEDFDLLGHALPAGTVVCTQAWSMHRNPDVFPSPESFLPERWLESNTSSDHLQQMHQHLMAFGTGSRVCGGQNLAHMVLRVVVSIIVRNFNLSAPKETNERSMEIKDSFVCGLLHRFSLVTRD